MRGYTKCEFALLLKGGIGVGPGRDQKEGRDGARLALLISPPLVDPPKQMHHKARQGPGVEIWI